MTVRELVDKLLEVIKNDGGDFPVVTANYSDLSNITSLSREIGITRNDKGEIKEQEFIILN